MEELPASLYRAPETVQGTEVGVLVVGVRQGGMWGRLAAPTACRATPAVSVMLTVALVQALLLLLLLTHHSWLKTTGGWCPCGLQQRECLAVGVLLLLLKAAAVAACGVGCLAAAAAAA